MLTATILAIMFSNLNAAAALAWLAGTVSLGDAGTKKTDSGAGALSGEHGTPQLDAATAGAVRSVTKTSVKTSVEMTYRHPPAKCRGLPPSRKAA